MERAEDRSAQVGPANANTLEAPAKRARGGGRPRKTGPPDRPPEDADATGQPGARAARWARRAAAKPPVRQFALIVCFLAVGVAMTWPRATFLGGWAPGSRDSSSYTWGFWWVARQLTHFGNPWFTTYMAAPVGIGIGFHTLMPLPGILLTPVTLAFGPVLSYNLLVVAAPGLLCYAAYRAARLWLRSGTGAIAAGAFFGYSAMLTQQAWYHVNIAVGAIFLPLALEASVRLRRNPGRRQGVILGLVMGAAVLTDQESAVLAAIVVALALAPWLARQRSPAALLPVGLAVALGVVIASPQIIAMIEEVAGGGLAVPANLLAVSYKQYGIGLPGMFSPTPRVCDFLTATPGRCATAPLGFLAQPFLHGRDNEGMPMFGSVLTAMAIVGIVASRRRRGAWLLAGLWLGCAVLALGTSLWIGKHQYLPLEETLPNGVRVSDLMPYTWFVRIPGLSSFREADRLAILGLLPAALLAGAAVEWLRDHVRPLLAVVLVLGVLEAGYAGAPNIENFRTSSWAAVDAPIAADHSRSVVLDFPFGLRGGIPEYGVPFFPRALYMATADGHPRSIAYTSRLPYTTIKSVAGHPFYWYLVNLVQHESSRTCPWRAPRQPDSVQGCLRPPVVPESQLILARPMPGVTASLTPSTLAAARRDARRMHIGWVVVWKRNPSVSQFVLPYLKETGFRFAYEAKVGGGWVLVYRHQGQPMPTCPSLPTCGHAK